jgi:hypothetical protein
LSVRGDAFFHGSWFVRPSEAQHEPTRLFYKREVFLSSIEDTNPLGSIISKCCVLHIKDYCSCEVFFIYYYYFYNFSAAEDRDCGLRVSKIHAKG